MGREISLFTGYSEKENRLTNYTLLLIRLLYQESPELYQSFLDKLLPEAQFSALPRFAQQTVKKTSIPDGFIAQSPYTIYFETKTSNWFYDDQLVRHLTELQDESKGPKALIAICPFQDGKQDVLNSKYRETAKQLGEDILFRALSFQELFDCFPPVGHETHLSRIKDEFWAFLRLEGYLGGWQEMLDVVNCATWPDHFTKFLVYTCPLTGRSYSHLRSKFLGLCKDKMVSHVALIRGVVQLYKSTEAHVEWRNDDTSEGDLIKSARERVLSAWGAHTEDLRVFILADVCPTQFEKDTRGGMWGSKQYFDLSKLRPLPQSSKQLAEALIGKRWTELRFD